MKPQPFLSTLAVAHEPRPLMSALRAIPTGPSTSPWSPKMPSAPAPMPEVDVEAIREAARIEGREQGMQETAALRGQLKKLADELARAHEAAVSASADTIADVACSVIAVWTETAPKTDLFAPIIKAWIGKVQDATTVAVHPDDVDAVRTVIGDASITIAADAAIARGDIRLRSVTRELSHEWNARIGELRELIAATITDAHRCPE